MAAKSPRLPKAIIVDLDGTLALLGDRSPYDAKSCEKDKLNVVVAGIIENASTHDGLAVVLLTGRQEKDRGATERWLKRHRVTYQELHMRATGDFRKDAVVKKELYERHIGNRYKIAYVLDDRDQVVRMWRHDLGLTCLQVADGAF